MWYVVTIYTVVLVHVHVVIWAKLTFCVCALLCISDIIQSRDQREA